MDRVCEGRVAIVTGASRGLGRAIAVRLAEAGARVAATARTTLPDPRQPGSLSETVEAIARSGGEAVASSSGASLRERPRPRPFVTAR